MPSRNSGDAFLCSSCGETLPSSLLAGGRTCRPCRYRKRRSRWYGSLPSYLGRLKTYAKKRAKKKGLKFDLSKEDLERLWARQQGKCALTGITMTRPDGDPQSLRVATNVSLDRINSSKGYTRDNVQLVCWRANQLKGRLSEEELVFWSKKFVKTLDLDNRDT